MIPEEVEALAVFLESTPTIAAEIYANGTVGRAKPLVDNHFTHGGQAQYGFAPLSPKYAQQKNDQTVRVRGGGFIMGGSAGRALSEKSQKAIFSASGASATKLSGGSLPILVRTGKLRSMVASMRHAVTQSGDVATVTFSGLPEYAQYLQDGTPNMPARSPVNPGPRDLQEIDAELKKRLSVILGQAQRYGSFTGSLPAVARMA